MPDRNMVLVICADMQQFHLWCSEQHPQQNPNDRKFVVFTASNWDTKARGFHKQEGDRLILLDRIDGRPYPSLMGLAMVLVPCGFDVIEIDGEPHDFRAFL